MSNIIVFLETDRWRLFPHADGTADAELKCPHCGGSGVVDSGGQTPWGQAIERVCEECGGTGEIRHT